MAPVLIQLTDEEMRMAVTEGMARQDRHPAHHANSKRVHADEYSEHTMGAVGEMALAKWSGDSLKVDWSARLGGDRGIDFLIGRRPWTVDVKTRKDGYDLMLVPVNRVTADIYIGATCNGPMRQVRLWGVRSAKFVRTCVTRGARNASLGYRNYEINMMTQMRPMSEFAEWIKRWPSAPPLPPEA